MEYIYTDEPIERAANATADAIAKHLALGERVLWLLSGGSSIPIAVQASHELLDKDLSNLYVSLTDERYGPVGHKDENWRQLLDAGLSLLGANLYRPLIGQSRHDTTIAFADWLEVQLENSDFEIANFGLGSDGHTAGIKPHSIAVVCPDLAASYQGDDFERISITITLIKQLGEAIIQASGPDKRKIINELVNTDQLLTNQPAQILKTIPVATLYTNNEKEK